MLHEMVDSLLVSQRVMRQMFWAAVGCGLMASLIVVSGPEGLSGLSQLNYGIAVAIVLPTIALTGLMSLRWQMILRRLVAQPFVGWRRCHRYVATSMLIGCVLPRELADIGGRTLCLNQLEGIPIKVAVSSTVIDRLFDIGILLVLLPVVSLYWFFDFEWHVTFAVALFAVIAVLAALQWFFDDLLRIGEAIVRPVVARFASLRKFSLQSNQALDGIDSVLATRLYLISLAKLVALMLRTIMIAWAFGLEISPVVLVLATPFGQLGNSITLTPGAIGVSEAGWFVILKMAGITSPDALAFVVGQRILVTLAGVALVPIAIFLDGWSWHGSTK